MSVLSKKIKDYWYLMVRKIKGKETYTCPKHGIMFTVFYNNVKDDKNNGHWCIICMAGKLHCMGKYEELDICRVKINNKDGE